MSDWTRLKERTVGKWQLPLFATSLAALSGAVVLLRPDPSDLSFDEAADTLDTLVTGGLYERAVELGEIVLDREDCVGAECAPIHLQVARARFGVVNRRGGGDPETGDRVVDHYREAASHKQPLTASDFEHLGRALEWSGQFKSALEWYEEAVKSGHARAMDLRKHIIALTRDELDAPPERIGELVDAFLEDLDHHRLDLRLWALEEKLHVLDERGKVARGEELLNENTGWFAASDLKQHFDFLQAWVLYKTRRFDEAEALLRSVRNQVERHDEEDAMTGWLLGHVVMRDGGPQRPLEALSFFRDVLDRHTTGPYAAASRVGLAESLAMLERHDEAAVAYQVAIEDIEAFGGDRLVDLDVLRTSLAVAAETERRAGHLRSALSYARLGADLADRERVEQAVVHLRQLARIASQYADELHRDEVRRREEGIFTDEAPSDSSRDIYAEAASTYAELAEIDVADDRRAAESSWQAAELYTKAGDRGRAMEIYRAFTIERPTNPLVARALHRLGRLQQTAGHLAEAVETYRECYRRFPQTLDGIRTLIPLAQCYLSMGPDGLDLAEKTLSIVLEGSDVFTPQAPEFADALFLLGDVLTRRREYERAITSLEEALERYPEDPRVWRARFLLADSYRQSALALRGEVEDAKFEGEIQQIRAESAARLASARGLYRELIMEYELRGPAGLDRLERLYLRHSYLYEADCYFDGQEYRHALKLYEETVGAYKELPTALAAHVQIINCHVFLGEPREARAALARARVLLDSMSAEVFEESVSPETSEDWKNYFGWLAQSELF